VITQNRVSLEQFLKLPEQEPALEFADGVISQKVSPKGRHSILQAQFVLRIDHFARPLKLALAFPELRTSFAGASRVSDVAVYRWERIPVDAAGRVVDDFLIPPDIAIEIVSPEQSVNALVRRCLWYVANGVAIALLVDPSDESVLVFRPNQAPVPLRGAEPIDLAEVLPGFQLTVQELFDSLTLQP
jgi:Uma2 family endonuclease